jgi:hypothetical protein
MLKAELPDRIEEAKKGFKAETVPKIMVRADDLDKLVALQSEIDRVFKTASVLIHDRARKTPKNKNRFTSVASACLARPDAQFWIHQFKLMEGIDDPSFVALAIFDLMGNARQLVQQIGRVTRHSNGDRRLKQISWVFATSSNETKIQTSWDRYIAYETYAARNTSFIVSNEVTLPDRLLKHMPEYQYVGGEFRSRFEIEAPLSAEDIQLPQSAALFRTSSELNSIADLGELIEEAILDKDRLKITPIQGMPENSIGFSYYAWRNSPLLIDRFFSEWRLGLFVAVPLRCQVVTLRARCQPANVLECALEPLTPPRGFWELQQLRSLCEYEDQQVFEPLNDSDLQRWHGRRIGEFRDLAFEVVESSLDRDLVDKKGGLVSSFESVGRYFRLKGWECWLGVHWGLWATQEHQSPLWLFIRDDRATDDRAADYPGMAEALRKLQIRGAFLSNDGHRQMCLHLPTGVDRDTVLRSLTKQVKDIAELLPPAPISTSTDIASENEAGETRV